MNTKQNKSRAVMLRLTPEQHRALVERATREDRSVASVIRVALSAHFEELAAA